MMCHLLLTQIPDEGLDELFETMKEIRDYYVARTKYVSVSTQTQEKHIRIEGSQVRPTFVIAEEEE